MSETAQYWIAAAVALLAAFFVGRSAVRAWRRFRAAAGRDGPSCGGCGSCGGESAAARPQRVEMGLHPKSAGRPLPRGKDTLNTG